MKTDALIFVIALIIGMYTAYKVIGQPITNPVKPTQQIHTSITVPKDTKVVVPPKVTVTTINKRGDKKVEPISTIVERDGKELPIIITPEDILINPLNKYKFLGVCGYGKSVVKGGLGVAYEVMNYGDYNLNLGLTNLGIFSGLSKSLSQTSEVGLGLIFSQEEPLPCVTFAIRF